MNNECICPFMDTECRADNCMIFNPKVRMCNIAIGALAIDDIANEINALHNTVGRKLNDINNSLSDF